MRKVRRVRNDSETEGMDSSGAAAVPRVPKMNPYRVEILNHLRATLEHEDFLKLIAAAEPDDEVVVQGSVTNADATVLLGTICISVVVHATPALH